MPLSSLRHDSVVVCSFAFGMPLYFAALRQAVLSALRHTTFDVFALVGADCPVSLPASCRFHPLRAPAAAGGHRSFHFLTKFRALQACIEHSDAEAVLYLDADAVFTHSISGRDVVEALGDYELAMVEQRLPVGSSQTPAFFYDHYSNYTRAWFGAGGDPPPRDDFRFFNSGVVLARRKALARLCDWALATIDGSTTEHQIGVHMIADQDYIQFWANELHPRTAGSLDWSWNHCEHWHSDFPRRGVRIAHLSNACHGPTVRNIWRLRALRTSPSIERTWRYLRGSLSSVGASNVTCA